VIRSNTLRLDVLQEHGKWLTLCCLIVAATLIFLINPAPATAAVIDGRLTQWHPLSVDFNGPFAQETDDGPNPFMDYRLVVEFTSPSGAVTQVPGFFAGDGRGNGSGSIWRARFAADEPGTWRYRANFRQGTDLAIDLDFNRGQTASFHGEEGSFNIAGIDPSASGFLPWGRLDYVGEHYLKFRNGPYWIKTGTDSPENFLAYAGFDATDDRGGAVQNFLHRYDPHRADFRDGDPLFVSRDTGIDSRGIIGALNYLSDRGVNSIYFLPMNLGGDGYDTHPFLAPERTPYFKTHFDISKLHQWNQVLDHAQNRGIALNVVLNETEIENREWHDDGQFGRERKLYYREMIARFGYLLAAKWNISEENNFPIDFVREAAAYLTALDWSAKPVSVHTPPDRFENYVELLGNPLISATSIQYNIDRASEYVETWRQRSRNAGVPWVLDMDENAIGLLDRNIDDLRRRVLYDVLFSGGNIEWYFGFGGLPLGGDITVEDFRTREAMWTQSMHARQLMQNNLPFHRMLPMDNLVSGENQNFGGAEVFAASGEIYAVYLPTANGNAVIRSGDFNGTWRLRWFNTLSGQFESQQTVSANGEISLNNPPTARDRDWVILIDRAGSNNSQSAPQPPAPPAADEISNVNQPVNVPGASGNGLRLEGLRSVTANPGESINLRLAPSSDNTSVPSMYLGNAPQQSSFDDNRDGSRSFNWQPSRNDIGTTTITVIVSDANNPANRQEFQFDVTVIGTTTTNTNDSSITTNTGDGSPTLSLPDQLSVSVGQLLELVVTPTDNDGSVPGVRLDSAPAGVSFDDNGNGGRVLRWIPNSADVGSHILDVTAMDAANQSLQTTHQLTVNVN